MNGSSYYIQEKILKGRVSWKTHNKRLFDLRNSKPLTPAQQFLNSFL